MKSLQRRKPLSAKLCLHLPIEGVLRMKHISSCLLVAVLIHLSACSEDQTASVASVNDKVPNDQGLNKKALGYSANITVLATGASIAGANGLHFSPDGELYVASVLGSNLTVIDPDSGEILKQLSSESGVYGPDDVAFAPDGAFYWTSILTGEVAGITAGGEQVRAAQLSAGVNPITFSNDGRLFVAQCFYGDKLYELDPKGVEAPRLISDQLGPGCGLNGMDWGPDNRLYGPRWFTGEVVSFDVDDNSMRVEVSGLKTPAAVKFNAKGELHVLDTGTGEVFKVEDGKLQLLASLEPGLDNFAFDAQDRLYVSSFSDGYVKRQEDDGSMRALLPGGLAHPGGITVYKGQLYLADLHAIRNYALDGEVIEVQRNIFGSGEMGSTLNIAADGDNLILTAWTDGSVRVWDPVQKKVLQRFDNLPGPVAAMRYAGQIVIAEHGLQRVVAYDGDKVIEYATGLSTPTGLASYAGGLYVSDYADGKIFKIAQDGVALATPEVAVDALTSPEGFVVNAQGFVVVESEPGRVVFVDWQGVREKLADISPGSKAASAAQPPSMVFNGITQAENGAYYLSVETSRTLLRLDR